MKVLTFLSDELRFYLNRAYGVQIIKNKLLILSMWYVEKSEANTLRYISRVQCILFSKSC